MRPERLTREQIAPGEFHCHRVAAEVYACHSGLQRIEVLETEGYGRGLFLDGRVQHVQADEYIYSESMVHPAVTMAGTRCDRVLCIGGGPGGIVRELLKYAFIEQVVQVDIDPAVIEVSRRYFPHVSLNCWDDPRFTLVIADALSYLRAGGQCFDLVINDLSEPLPGSPAAALFSIEALRLIRSRLHPVSGMYVSWCGSAGPRSIDLAARVNRTIREAFPSACAFLTHPQAYGTSWLTAIGAMSAIDPLSHNAASIDRFLAAHVGELHLYDGETHHHMFRLPKDVRRVLHDATAPFSVEDPASLDVEHDDKATGQLLA